MALSAPNQKVALETSGHRGSAADASFNQAHILAITQAICEFRSQKGASGPFCLGMDTRARSEAAHMTALEVLAANPVPGPRRRRLAVYSDARRIENRANQLPPGLCPGGPVKENS